MKMLFAITIAAMLSRVLKVENAETVFIGLSMILAGYAASKDN